MFYLTCVLSLVIVVTLIQPASLSGSDFGRRNGSQGPIVNTKCGKFEGKIITTPRGQCDAYLGVPFAAPPIGDLRWKKPQAPACWTGIQTATKSGPQCIQLGSIATDPRAESEDCLYLNIFVPKTAGNPSSKLPVMVYIHFGAFVIGTAWTHGQEGPCENLALRGVIVVLIQYRLFIYGFLSTGDDTALGNYGLWDQIEALRWISKHIDSFGGDPKRVTVFGESAGGASVSYLTYTPIAQDLFHQSIAQSGSALARWAAPRDSSIATAKKIALAANCTGPDSKSFVQCLRKLSTAELQTIYNKNMNLNITMDFADIWSIRVDGELFTEAKLNELSTGHRKPVMIGATSLEMPLPERKNLPKAKTMFNQTLNRIFNGSDAKKNQILKQIAQYVYIGSKRDPNNDTLVEQQRTMFEADRDFHAPAAAEAVSKSANGRPVWVYNFDYWSDKYFETEYPFQKGAGHAHELCYLFLLSPAYFGGCPPEYKGTDRQVADYLGEMWTNFAIKGDPSPKNLVWPKFKGVSNASTMTIRSNLSIESQFFPESARFWNQMVPSKKGKRL